MTRVKLQVLTNSQRGSFLSCSQLYGFRHVDLLRPKLTAPYFAFGKAFHAGCAQAIWAAFDRDNQDKPLPARQALAALYGTRAAIQEQERYYLMLREIDDLHADREVELRERAEADVELLAALIERYVDAVPGDWDHMIPVAVELPFHVPVLNKGGRRDYLYLDGVIDVLWYDTLERDLVVEDHKTTSGAVDGYDRKIEQDPQLTGYLYAVQWMLRNGHLDDALTRALSGVDGLTLTGGLRDIPVGRVRYNVIRKKVPAEPKILKSGLVSSDQRQDTTVELYRTALDRQQAACLACEGSGFTGPDKAPEGVLPESWNRTGCKPCDGSGKGTPISAKQIECLGILTGKAGSWFVQREYWRGPEQIERLRRELYVDARRMREVHASPFARTRNLGHCTGVAGRCDYWTICPEWSPENGVPEELLGEFRIAETRNEEVTEAVAEQPEQAAGWL